MQGLASKMALAYAVNQGASVVGQMANKPSAPYPQPGAPAPGAHGGQATGYYQQGESFELSMTVKSATLTDVSTRRRSCPSARGARLPPAAR